MDSIKGLWPINFNIIYTISELLGISSKSLWSYALRSHAEFDIQSAIHLMKDINKLYHLQTQATRYIMNDLCHTLTVRGLKLLKNPFNTNKQSGSVVYEIFFHYNAKIKTCAFLGSF